MERRKKALLLTLRRKEMNKLISNGAWWVVSYVTDQSISSP
jgi:hypothetical protein